MARAGFRQILHKRLVLAGFCYSYGESRVNAFNFILINLKDFIKSSQVQKHTLSSSFTIDCFLFLPE